MPKIKGKHSRILNEDLEKLAQNMKGKPVTDPEGNVIGKVLTAQVVEDYVEYEAEIIGPVTAAG